MTYRPSDLADRMSKDALPRESFTLPVEVARAKVREILDRFPQNGYTTIVESWRQLPDGQIEFSMRRLPTAE
jgi:hypothetical protein